MYSGWTDLRGQILGALEEAIGRALPAQDPLPDTLIAKAQALGMLPHELRSWIYDSSARPDWQVASLVRFAERYHFARSYETPEGNLNTRIERRSE